MKLNMKMYFPIENGDFRIFQPAMLGNAWGLFSIPGSIHWPPKTQNSPPTGHDGFFNASIGSRWPGQFLHLQHSSVATGRFKQPFFVEALVVGNVENRFNKIDVNVASKHNILCMTSWQ